jgi:hypothetical protein
VLVVELTDGLLPHIAGEDTRLVFVTGGAHEFAGVLLAADVFETVSKRLGM